MKSGLIIFNTSAVTLRTATQDTGRWTQDAGHCPPTDDAGRRTLDAGHWTQDA